MIADGKTLFLIQMRSIAAAITHLQLIDLTELAAGAERYGSAADAELIEHIRAFLNGLPPAH